MKIAKFIIHDGRITSQETFSPEDQRTDLLTMARDAFARLLKRESDVSLSWPDGQVGVVGLGLSPFDWEDDRETVERGLKRSAFYISTAGGIELHQLAAHTKVENIAYATLYGAIVGTSAITRRQENEREPLSSSGVQRQVRAAIATIVAATPAFICGGRLHGDAAAFANCFAAVLLSDPDALQVRVTAA